MSAVIDELLKRPSVEKLLTAEEVAGQLQVSKDWVYRAARTGLLPSVALGRNTRFRAAEIQAFINGGGSDGR